MLQFDVFLVKGLQLLNLLVLLFYLLVQLCYLLIIRFYFFFEVWHLSCDLKHFIPFFIQI